MSGEKTTTQQTQQAQMSPEERALLSQQLANNAFMQPYAQKNYAALSDNINAILTGNEPMAKGIGGIDESQTQSMVNASLRDIYPQFQSAGILDSGTAIQGATRAAADVRNQNAQFNVSAAQNLFNLASGGQSNLQGQYQGSANSLTSQLAGLRSVSNRGTTIGMNPFLKSFQQSAGQSLGSNFDGSKWVAAAGGCWVAAEIFGGWYAPKTVLARNYMNTRAPKWLLRGYIKYGRRIAEFIKDYPIFKVIIKPLFELFAKWGK